MKLSFLLSAAGVALGWSGAAVAEAPLPLASAFGAREAVQGANLSPDGKMLSFIAPTEKQGNALFTVPVDGSASPKRLVSASGNPERLTSCGWVANTRLVCDIYTLRNGSGYLVGGTSQVAVDADGANLKLVSQRQAQNAWYYSTFGGSVIDWLPGEDGAVLMGHWYVPESKAGSLIEKRGEGYGVDRIDTRTLAAKKIVAPMLYAERYISDGQGNVRIAGTSKFTGDYVRTGMVHYIYRPKNSTDWKDLGDYNDRTDEGFLPIAVDSSEDVAYGLKKKDGRFALYKRTLDGSMNENLVFARDDVDVDGLVRLGRRHRIIGATFATDRRQSYYFDPAMMKLAASLSKALPGAPLINFEGASDDEQKLLVWAGSDTDPGKYYLLDRATKQMRPLIQSRPELADVQLAPVKSVMVKAADGTSIPAYLTLPPGSSGKGLPALVMPHGGPSARDEWGFDWLAQYFANRGYAVLQPNFRGSSGYGDSWFRNNGFKNWKVALGDVTDSGRWLVQQGIADPSKLGIFGWSYGGYAALQSGVIAPDLFKAIVAVAPVTDFEELKKQYLNSSDEANIRDFVGSGPHVREGSPAQNAGAFKAPVLMFHGELDQNVKVIESKMMANRLDNAGKSEQLVLYPNLDHQLDDSTVRADMLVKSDAFLRTSMGIK